MKGREAFAIKKTFTNEELLQFMEEHWNKEEFGSFTFGRPTSLSISEYIMLPATENFIVILYPKKEKLVFSVADGNLKGLGMSAATVATNSLILKFATANQSMNRSKEMRGPAHEIMMVYANHMKELLKAEGLM